MLEELNKHFDHYTINARFKPAFFAVLPAVLTILIWYPNAKTLLGGTITILISFGVMTFISGLISNLGNTLQSNLFIRWGGASTTCILRHSDTILDTFTKSRYHQWLASKISGLSMPTPEAEIDAPDIADQKYLSATNFMREYTRDKIKYPAIYRDLVAYGFARNLLAIRVLGLCVSAVSLLTNGYLLRALYLDNNSVTLGDFLNLHFVEMGSITLSAVMFIVFLLLVNSNYVKGRAIRYAKSLYEVCEQI